MTDYPVKRRKKLIEVAIPLEAISKASSREKSIRHGHPSTMHLWWSRKPLATARAILFCQLVDDPGSIPEEFRNGEEIERERARLLSLCSELCEWENTNNATVLNAARSEITKTWQRALADNGWASDESKAEMPAVYDPFAGGGSIPLEAQRLGMKCFASDINPVSALLNKALIEIPPLFGNKAPVSDPTDRSLPIRQEFSGANGLCRDVLFYGEQVMRRSYSSLCEMYSPRLITSKDCSERPELKQYEGQRLEVIAWLWVRTVKSPNPLYSSIDVPLTTTYFLSSKKGKEAWVDPIISEEGYSLPIRIGNPKDLKKVSQGTRVSQGKFRCLLSGEVFDYKYVDKQAEQEGLGSRLIAVVLQGKRERLYIEPNEQDIKVSTSTNSCWKPSAPSKGTWASNAQGRRYGFQTFGDYFSGRQLVVANEILSQIELIEAEIAEAAKSSGQFKNEGSLENLEPGFVAYAQAVVVYLTFALSKVVNINSTIASWMVDRGAFRETFARQGIAMSWDYAEANPFAATGGSYLTAIEKISKAITSLPCGSVGQAFQCDAKGGTNRAIGSFVISTDPPYYDNIGYADLSDYFYVWLRKCLRHVYPSLFATISTPKDDEIFASPTKYGSKQKAEAAFLSDMKRTMTQISDSSHPSYPISLYYAFKQTEKKDAGGFTSTGWETFLESIIESGLAIVGTWPIRTESSGRIVANSANALATSILLVCRKRDPDSGILARSEYKRRLREQIKKSVREFEASDLAPVDIAQAAMGPGMAVYSQSRAVLNPDDSSMTVREALLEITAALDEYLSQHEGELDADSRFALAFFESFGYSQRDFGDAEGLARARNVSVEGVAKAGILRSVAGKAWLLRRDQLAYDWDPSCDERLCVWEATQHLIKRLETGGEGAAAELLGQLKKVSGHGDLAANCKALAYRLYNHCEKNKQAEEARAYNGLVIAWPELERLAASQSTETAVQASLI